jgi:hypothetical protein
MGLSIQFAYGISVLSGGMFSFVGYDKVGRTLPQSPNPQVPGPALARPPWVSHSVFLHLLAMWAGMRHPATAPTRPSGGSETVVGKVSQEPQSQGKLLSELALLLLDLCLPEQPPNSQRVYRLLGSVLWPVFVGGVMHSPPLGPVDDGDC